MQESLYHTADAEVSLLDSETRSLCIRQRMQEYLHQTADERSLFQTADAGYSLSDSGCRSFSIRQRMQEYLHQTADAGDSLSDSG